MPDDGAARAGPAPAAPLPASLYTQIWRVSGGQQIAIVLMTALIAPLAMVPLDLQRRMVDDAIGGGAVHQIAILAGIWLGVILLQGALKYILNMIRSRVLEGVTRDLRLRVLAHARADGPGEAPIGTFVAILVAEAEDVGGFASDSFAVPVLQISTILWVFGYLATVEPVIAALAVVLYLPQGILVPLVQRKINRLIRMKTIRLRLLGGDETTALSRPDVPADTTLAHARRLVAHIFSIRMRIYRLKYALTALGNLLDALGPLLVLSLGGLLVIRGETSVSTLVVFISGLQKVGDPWDVLINFFRTVSNARVSYRMIVGALSGEPVAIGARLTSQQAARARRRFALLRPRSGER